MADPNTPPADNNPPADNPPADPPKDTPPPTPPKGDEGKGSKDAVLADLAKERDKRQSLEQQVNDLQASQQQQLDAIAKALGLKSDDTPPDPAKLTEQLTSEQQKARDAQIQLAVYRNAKSAGGDADALLDSASFLSGLADVNPADNEAVASAIKTAVEANPRLAVPEERKPAPSFGGGPRKTDTGKTDVKPGMGRLRAAYADK